jgi:hypothetical protein
MRNILAGLLLLSSLSSFASTLDIAVSSAHMAAGPITGEHAEIVKKALKSEINASTVSCTDENYKSDAVKAFLIASLEYEKTVISIDDVLEQPAISTLSDLDEGKELVINYTTTSDFKKIQHFEARWEKVVTTEKNVGTLVNPRFEIVQERIVEDTLSCTLK